MDEGQRARLQKLRREHGSKVRSDSFRQDVLGNVRAMLDLIWVLENVDAKWTCCLGSDASVCADWLNARFSFRGAVIDWAKASNVVTTNTGRGHEISAWLQAVLPAETNDDTNLTILWDDLGKPTLRVCASTFVQYAAQFVSEPETIDRFYAFDAGDNWCVEYNEGQITFGRSLVCGQTSQSRLI